MPQGSLTKPSKSFTWKLMVDMTALAPYLGAIRLWYLFDTAKLLERQLPIDTGDKFRVRVGYWPIFVYVAIHRFVIFVPGMLEHRPTPGGPRCGPISYTHLRAHETRHDLVCRL